MAQPLLLVIHRHGLRGVVCLLWLAVWRLKCLGLGVPPQRLELANGQGQPMVNLQQILAVEEKVG